MFLFYLLWFGGVFALSPQYFRDRTNICINVSLLLPLQFQVSVGSASGLENFPRCGAKFISVRNEQEKWDRTKATWEEQLQKQREKYQNYPGNRYDTFWICNRAFCHRGEQHDERMCDLALDFYLKLLMSPANLSLISIIKEKEEIRST